MNGPCRNRTYNLLQLNPHPKTVNLGGRRGYTGENPARKPRSAPEIRGESATKVQPKVLPLRDSIPGGPAGIKYTPSDDPQPARLRVVI